MQKRYSGPGTEEQPDRELRPTHKNGFGIQFRCEYMQAHVLALGRRMEKLNPGELLMYWFRARGILLFVIDLLMRLSSGSVFTMAGFPKTAL